MKLKYVIEKISPNGTKDILSSEINKPEIYIGRGSSSDILLQSTFVSLNHAKIKYVDDSLCIEDPGSLSTVIVNGKIERNRVLDEGDIIKLADVTLEVFKQDGIWGLKEVRQLKEQVDTEELIKKQNAALNISNKLPPMKLLCTVLFLLTAGYFFVYPYFTKKQNSWSSGPLSSHHSMISADCTACHSGNFKQIEDKKCLSCHNMTEHSEFLKNHKELEGRCATCHMEHNGPQVVLHDSNLCLSCHADIKKIHPETDRPSVPSFEKHPQFRVEVQAVIPGGPSTRVSLDDTANLKDNSNVKLNHKIHLEPIRSKTGMVELQCRDCHEASKDLTSINKINFDKHCRSCHGLEFDDRLKGKEVPHAAPDVVYKFLYAEYAKLMLGSDDTPQAEESFNRRFKPGQAAPSVQAAPAAKDDFKQAFVEKESRGAERLLFTKTACYMCHRMLEKDSSDKTPERDGLSKFEVIKPQIPVDWMPGAKFDHGAHEEVKCEDCHKGVYDSTKTNQILMPKAEDCRVCHIDTFKHGLVKSDCTSCHSYHDQLLVDPAKKREVKEILKAVM